MVAARFCAWRKGNTKYGVLVNAASIQATWASTKSAHWSDMTTVVAAQPILNVYNACSALHIKF